MLPTLETDTTRRAGAQPMEQESLA